MDNLEDLLDSGGASAVEALDDQVAANGPRLAIRYGEEGRDLSYAAFGRLTDSIAGNLAASGIGRGSRVSVFTANPLLTALWMYGIWKAGAVYSPVNFSYTGRLLAYQLADTSPDLVVVSPELLPALRSATADLPRQPRLAVHGQESGDVFLDPAARPAVPVAWHDTANIIYTSGTTGPSKGVVQTHRWVNQYTWTLRRVLTPDDVVYNDLPMYHVGGAMANVVRALWAGASVSLWDRFSVSDFWHRVNSTGVTTAILLDVMIPRLASAPERPADRENPLNKAHMQPLPLAHHEFARRFGIDFVTAGFGQTESGAPLKVMIEETPDGDGTPGHLYRGLSHEEMRSLAQSLHIGMADGAAVTRKGFMGQPAAFFDVAVLDEHDSACPPGQAGELAVRSRVPGTIVQEYLGKPEATAHAFRNLWFHTGDAAVTDDDGNFIFIDRLGDRIRVRGENVSSFHVEDILNQRPDIAVAAVFGAPSAEGDEDEIVAYVQPEPGCEPDPGVIQGWCAERMPRFMRPAHLRVIDSIPRTPTNKIEKYKLKQLFRESRGTPPDRG